MIEQRGSFVLGLVVGLLVGLSLALGVALYITKAPVPFMNKVPPRTAAQDKAEAERNRNWDPNAPLGSRTATKPGAAGAVAAPATEASAPGAATPSGNVAAPAASAAAVSPAISPTIAPTTKSSRDAAALLAGTAPPAAATARPSAAAADPFVYFVQIGAYASADEAEQQRAKLALSGLTAKVTEREQSGRTVYRVRLGPYEKKEEADGMQTRLTEASVEARLVRIERN